MQPHQFSYCSCLHLSKTRAKLYTSDSWGTVELKSVRTRARSKSLSPSKPNPPIHTVGLPSALLSLAVKVQAAGLGRPAPAPSTPESGIPAHSPSAVRGRRWLSQAARPRLSPDPRKHGAKWAKFPQSPNSSAPKKGWEVGYRREVQEGGDICIPMADSCDVWQKSNQYCKAIILQLQINKF